MSEQLRLSDPQPEQLQMQLERQASPVEDPVGALVAVTRPILVSIFSVRLARITCPITRTTAERCPQAAGTAQEEGRWRHRDRL
jgi:hypothetical protein